MNRAIFYIAATMLAFAPSMARAQCSGDCAVGAAGTGDVQSGGKAQGFLFRGIDQEHNSQISNSGNSTSGHLVVSDPALGAGSISGTIQKGNLRGQVTGFFGDCDGLCPDPFEELP